MELNNLFSALNATNGKGANSSAKRSIYKETLFEGLTEKEEKSLRKKLRNSLEDCVISFERAKKAGKDYDFAAFSEFANGVYFDLCHIYSGTRISETSLKNFVEAWNKSESFHKVENERLAVATAKSKSKK